MFEGIVTEAITYIDINIYALTPADLLLAFLLLSKIIFLKDENV